MKLLGHSLQDRVSGSLGNHRHVGTRIVTVVIAPGSAEHRFPEFLPIVERVRRGAQRCQRPAGIQIGSDVIQLVRGQLEETQVEDGEIGVLQRLESRQALRLISNQHTAPHVVTRFQFLSDPGQSALREVLGLPGNKHDVRFLRRSFARDALRLSIAVHPRAARHHLKSLAPAP